jgi:hypothetical protein
MTVLFNEVGVPMTAKSARSNVVSLEAHPARRSAQRRSDEFMAAMRRHPSYQGALLDSPDDHSDAVVLRLCAR